ncbi:hypothetical protein K435DRAFT_857479 [Dendrothele bispora CBS 962.96]|uniref:Uncharacterized protein n=1 Tax=Dendrothele bispora (strain CBS 962.96) TaxID=1314807 RepID=A0A4S8M5S5_DENBC|nr:hypothetical protein K435DRAFT_857479 [Dendrothele bispora CBS 962.96]
MSSSSRSSLQLFSDAFKKAQLPAAYGLLAPADSPTRTLVDIPSVLGYDREPWRALFLLAIWYPILFDPPTVERLSPKYQAILFAMVASAMDNYMHWWMHPSYSEPIPILALKMHILRFFKGNAIFRRTLQDFSAANGCYHKDIYEEALSALETKKVQMDRYLKQQTLLAVEPLKEPLPTGEACPVFADPPVLPKYFIEIPNENTELAYPSTRTFPSLLKPEDIPLRFQWIWYVKQDVLETTFGLTLPEGLSLRVTSPSPSVDEDFAMAGPSAGSKTSAQDVDYLAKLFGPKFAADVQSSSNSPKAKTSTAAGPSSVPPVKSILKRKVPDSPSEPTAAPKKVRQIKLGPVSPVTAGSYTRQRPSPSSRKPKTSLGPKVKPKPSPDVRIPERENLIDDEAVESDTPQSPVMMPSPLPPDDPMSSEESSEEGSDSDSESSDSSASSTKSKASPLAKKTPVRRNKNLVQSDDEDDRDSQPLAPPPTSSVPSAATTSSAQPAPFPLVSPYAGPAASLTPAVKPKSLLAPIPETVRPTRDLPKHKNWSDLQGMYKSQEFVEDSSEEERIPSAAKGKGRADPPRSSSGSLVPAGRSTSNTSRVIGDYVLPPSVYGVKYLEKEIAAATRASQIQAEDRVSAGMKPVQEPCLHCGLASKVCYVRGSASQACLNCIKSGTGCNFAPSKLGRSLDLASEHAKFSLAHLDALAQDKSRAQLQFELAAANYALAASNLSTSSYCVAASLVKAEAAIPGRLGELSEDSHSSPALKEEIANLESSRETFGIEYPVEGANCDEDGQFELPPELVEWFEKHSDLPPGAPRRKNPPPCEYLREGADTSPARFRIFDSQNWSQNSKELDGIATNFVPSDSEVGAPATFPSDEFWTSTFFCSRFFDLQNRLEDNQGRYNYQSCADAEAVLIVLADITHTPEAPSLLQDTEFMENEFLPRRRSAEAVFNALSLEMPRSHGEVQSFSEGSGRSLQRPPCGGSYIGTPRPAPNCSIVSSSHAPASVRVSSGDVEMAETAPTPPPKTSEGKGTSEGSSATKSSKKKKGKKKEEPIPISDDEAPATTQRASRPRTPHQLETTISTAELVDQAQKTVSAGQELSRKRAQADSEEAATTVRQVQALRDQYRLINPRAVQGILQDLSPLSEAGLVTVLHLAREYQEALLPSATGAGTSGTRRVLEAISMLEARICTSALEMVLQMNHLQGSIQILQDLLGENAALLSGPEIDGLRQLVNITGLSAGPSNVVAGPSSGGTGVISTVEADPDSHMESVPEEAVATASAPASAAPSEAETDTSDSNKTV